QALADPFRPWLADLAKRVEAGQDVASELREGAGLVRTAADRAPTGDGRALTDWLKKSESAKDQAAAVAAAREEALLALIDRRLDRTDPTWAERQYERTVDRGRARFAA